MRQVFEEVGLGSLITGILFLLFEERKDLLHRVGLAQVPA